MKTWEKVTFRIFGMYAKDSRFQVGNYVRLAREIINTNIDEDEIKNRIVAIAAGFPIEGAIAETRKANCYEGCETELRYLLHRYEESLVRGKLTNENWTRIWMESASKSIEHISPQSMVTNYTHWLGNLLLLPPGINSQLKNKEPRDKIKTYRETGLKIALQVVDMIENNNCHWTEEMVIEREEKILEWARTEWGD